MLLILKMRLDYLGTFVDFLEYKIVNYLRDYFCCIHYKEKNNFICKDFFV